MALKNLKKGVPASKAGEQDNPYCEWIGADIRSDPWGYMAPGWPEFAADMAYRDAYLSHRRQGIYGEMFFSAAIAAAFAVDDPVEALEIGLTEIPRDCALAKAVRWALKVSPKIKNYKEARAAVDEQFAGMQRRPHDQQRLPDHLGHHHRRHRLHPGDRRDRRDGPGQRLHGRHGRLHRRRLRGNQGHPEALVQAVQQHRPHVSQRHEGLRHRRPGEALHRPGAARVRNEPLATCAADRYSDSGIRGDGVPRPLNRCHTEKHMKARAIVFTGPDRVELREVNIPEPAEGQVLIETLYTVVSPGTELRILGGKQFPKAFPVIPGYAIVGRVLRTGPGGKLPAGTLVFSGGTTKADVNCLWGGQVSHAIRPESDVHPVPEGLNMHEVPLAKMAAIAYHGMKIAPPRSRDTVAVVGLGVIGQLSARCYNMHGARVLGLDLVSSRVDVARKAGIQAAVPEGSLVQTIKKAFPEGVDIIVDATGDPQVLRQLMPAARQHPWDNAEHRSTRYLLQGSYISDFTLSYGDVFVAEMSILVTRDCQPRDISAVLEFMPMAGCASTAS